MSRPRILRCSRPDSAAIVKNYKRALEITWNQLARRIGVSESLLRVYAAQDQPLPLDIWNTFCDVAGAPHMKEYPDSEPPPINWRLVGFGRTCPEHGIVHDRVCRPSLKTRLKTNAGEGWKKTYVLYGLLNHLQEDKYAKR